MGAAPIGNLCFRLEWEVLDVGKEVTSNCGAVVLLGVDYWWGCLGRVGGFVGGRIRERYEIGGVVVDTSAAD